MDEQARKPSGWYYLLAVLILVIGCGISFAIILLSSGGILGIISDVDDTISQLSRVVVPGSADLELSTSGTINVYYEHRSVVDGKKYISSQRPPSLDCSIMSQDDGKEIPIESYSTVTSTYSIGMDNYEGALINRFTIQEPGTYRIDCQYQDGTTEPEIVLAIGQNVVWDILGVVGRAGATLLGSLAVLCGSTLIAVILAIIIAAKRSPSKQEPSRKITP